MGIYKDGDYTLVRRPHKDGLFVQVQRDRKPRSTVNTANVESTLRALRLAWEMASARAVGVDYCDGYEVAVGYNRDRLVTRIKPAEGGEPVALVDAEYLPITGRVIKQDPAGTYQPVRHLTVQAGQAMIRHQRFGDRERRTRRDIAYRRITQAAAEAMFVNSFMTL